MIKAHPCKVCEVKTSKTGKHGHAKCNITGIDVMTGKKYNDVAAGHIPFYEFDLSKEDYMLMDVNVEQEYFSLFDEKHDAEVEVPYDASNSLHEEIAQAFADAGDVTYKVTVIRAPVGEYGSEKEEQMVLSYAALKE